MISQQINLHWRSKLSLLRFRIIHCLSTGVMMTFKIHWQHSAGLLTGSSSGTNSFGLHVICWQRIFREREREQEFSSSSLESERGKRGKREREREKECEREKRECLEVKEWRIPQSSHNPALLSLPPPNPTLLSSLIHNWREESLERRIENLIVF